MSARSSAQNANPSLPRLNITLVLYSNRWLNGIFRSTTSPMRSISNLLLTLLAILFSTTALSQTVTLSKTASVGCPDTPAIHGAVMTQDRYGNLYLASTANQGTIHGDFDIVKVSPSGNV